MPARTDRHPHRVDARSPYVVDTRELGRCAGSMLELERDVAAPEGWQLELVRVPAGAGVHLDLRLEAVVDGVLVTADLTAPLTGECGRCLEPIEDTLELSVSELFLYEPDPDDDELSVLDGDAADLGPVLRDAVVLALPLNPVCDEDCAGLCATCGVRLDDAEPGHSHEATDPRWAALAALNTQNPQGSATMEDTTGSAEDEARPASPREN